MFIGFITSKVMNMMPLNIKNNQVVILLALEEDVVAAVAVDFGLRLVDLGLDLEEDVVLRGFILVDLAVDIGVLMVVDNVVLVVVIGLFVVVATFIMVP